MVISCDDLPEGRRAVQGGSGNGKAAIVGPKGAQTMENIVSVRQPSKQLMHSQLF